MTAFNLINGLDFKISTVAISVKRKINKNDFYTSLLLY